MELMKRIVNGERDGEENGENAKTRILKKRKLNHRLCMNIQFMSHKIQINQLSKKKTSASTLLNQSIDQISK